MLYQMPFRGISMIFTRRAVYLGSKSEKNLCFYQKQCLDILLQSKQNLMLINIQNQMQNFNTCMPYRPISWFYILNFQEGTSFEGQKPFKNDENIRIFQNCVLSGQQNSFMKTRIPKKALNVILKGENSSEKEKQEISSKKSEEMDLYSKLQSNNIGFKQSNNTTNPSKPNQQKELTQQRRRMPIQRPKDEYVVQRTRRRSNGSWRQQELQKYLNFVRLQSSLFRMSEQEKAKVKINVLMSEKVKSKTPLQCHNHHFRMLKKFGSFDNILTYAESESDKRKTLLFQKRINASDRGQMWSKKQRMSIEQS